MDTVARVIAEVELLHCEGILVECIFRIFSQALLMFALLAYYRKLVMVDKWNRWTEFQMQSKNITRENAKFYAREHIKLACQVHHEEVLLTMSLKHVLHPST